MDSIYETKYDCCGCTACYSVCPVKAISMIEDSEGFNYPVINGERCVNCNKCKTVCPLKAKNNDNEPLHIYAAKNINQSVREKSSSGGIFSLLANYVESKGGVIYGAAFDENYTVRHMRAETMTEWKRFCVSKYVQSNLRNIFDEIKTDLKNNLIVLFSGTPCQIDGLKRYLSDTSAPTDKLITCDIVCHGTPSPKIWEDYLTYIEKASGKEIGSISFRDKDELGWHNSTLTIRDKKQNIILTETQKDNYFFQLFLCSYILRPACHKCRYSNFHRHGDITLGDFWGIEKHYKEFDDDKGVSLVMVNTKVGEEIWKSLQNSSDSFEVQKKVSIQPNLVSPSAESRWRKTFWIWYKKYGLKRTGQKMGYIPMSALEKVLIFVLLCVEKALGIFRDLVGCDDDTF